MSGGIVILKRTGNSSKSPNSQNNWNLVYCQNSIVKYNLSIMILFLSYLVLPLKLLVWK